MTPDALTTHLQTGATHTCHCWLISRTDGVQLGFTDHDGRLSFDGYVFAPQNGLSARAITSTTGLSVNNTEAFGVLSGDSISEADITAGRYDGAQVQVWLVRWDDVAARKTLFRGSLGEITRGQGGFQAELQGLTEGLNRMQGRSYLRNCSAVLGDGRCRVAEDQAAYRLDTALNAASDGQIITLSNVTTYNAGWFEGGLLQVRSGAAAGLSAMIKTDRGQQDRVITLWLPINAPLVPGDQLRLIAGCDKRPATCREKFNNFMNFQGFPDMPGDDWLVSVPRSDQTNSGGSLVR